MSGELSEVGTGVNLFTAGEVRGVARWFNDTSDVLSIDDDDDLDDTIAFVSKGDQHGHAEVRFDGARVPVGNVIGEEGGDALRTVTDVTYRVGPGHHSRPVGAHSSAWVWVRRSQPSSRGALRIDTGDWLISAIPSPISTCPVNRGCRKWPSAMMSPGPRWPALGHVRHPSVEHPDQRERG